MKKFFELRGNLDKKQTLILQITGFLILLLIWQIIAMAIGSETILPTPFKVISSYPDLYTNDFLIYNAFMSIKINLLGFLEAILIAIPLGFVLGLFPLFRELFSKPIDSLRFLPLTALTGLFIAWFGIEMNMKVQFLAFGIMVYLLPVVMQRIYEVEKVYPQTAYTLGAIKWQTIKSVYFPAVISKVSDDIRVLTAISWTYIIVPEMINDTGGVGSLIFKAGRRSMPEKVFAILIVIIIIGFLQDKLFKLLDKLLFPHKYN